MKDITKYYISTVVTCIFFSLLIFPSIGLVSGSSIAVSLVSVFWLADLAGARSYLDEKGNSKVSYVIWGAGYALALYTLGMAGNLVLFLVVLPLAFVIAPILGYVKDSIILGY